MNFFSKLALLPGDNKLLTDVNAAAVRLYDKLSGLDVKSLTISEYNKKYLGDYHNSLYSILQRYSYILAWSVAYQNVPLDEFVFIDYGGGTGILSLLAREFKIGTVIYSDIYDVSCKDAKVIAESIGNQADYYVRGDIDDVIRFLRTHSISCNAVASYDVIEHIYDIEGFLSKLHLLSDGSLSVLMSSAANNLNPRIRKSLMKSQREVEYKDRERKWGHKERDCLRAFLKVREEIIRKYAQDLTEKEIEHLARVTRGMIEADIKKCVNEYLKTGDFPQEPSHPTNTCDPYTGNWAEHLMDPYLLKDVLSKAGFKVAVFSGHYYGRRESDAKRLLASFLNLAIYIFKKQGIRIAPFLTIHGQRDV